MHRTKSSVSSRVFFVFSSKYGLCHLLSHLDRESRLYSNLKVTGSSYTNMFVRSSQRSSPGICSSSIFFSLSLCIQMCAFFRQKEKADRFLRGQLFRPITGRALSALIRCHAQCGRSICSCSHLHGRVHVLCVCGHNAVHKGACLRLVRHQIHVDHAVGRVGLKLGTDRIVLHEQAAVRTLLAVGLHHDLLEQRHQRKLALCRNDLLDVGAHAALHAQLHLGDLSLREVEIEVLGALHTVIVGVGDSLFQHVASPFLCHFDFLRCGLHSFQQLVRGGQLCFGAVSAVQQVFHCLHLLCGQLGAVELCHRRSLEARNVHRHGVALPAEGLGIRAVVHGLVALLGRLCGGVPHHVDHVTGIGVLIGAHLGLPGKAKALALLLANAHALHGGSQAVAGLKLRRVHVGFNGKAVVLAGDQAGVLHVVGPQVGGFRAAGALGHTGQTVPGCTIVIAFAVSLGVNHAMRNTGVELAGTVNVPIQFCHRVLSSFINRHQYHTLNTSWYKLSEIKWRS
nr:MAG TPA: hypothetical protein [Caudoviricetes sp.]